MRMRNPLRSEGDMYRFLWIVVGGFAVIVVAAVINTWLGVAVAVIAFVALIWWFLHEPEPAASGAPAGRRRVLVVAPHGTESVAVPEGAEVFVVVPAAEDDRRHDAEATAAAIGERLGARAEVGAADPALAAEDALRIFGADEILVAGDAEMADAIRARVAIPVNRA
jgi:hypothetical protein